MRAVIIFVTFHVFLLRSVYEGLGCDDGSADGAGDRDVYGVWDPGDGGGAAVGRDDRHAGAGTFPPRVRQTVPGKIPAHEQVRYQNR